MTTTLDQTILEDIVHLADRLIKLKEFGVKRIGIDESIKFHYDHIEKVCEDKNLDYQPYIDLYNQILTDNGVLES